MLILFTYFWGSDSSIQAEVGKLNGDLLQPSGIRYEVWSFSVRYLISIAYWKRLISGVKLSVVIPQAIGISLHNRIGDSGGEFLVVVLWGFSIGIQWLISGVFSIAYWKRLIFGVKLSVMVPQAIVISLHNRIGDSAREFLVVFLWGFSISI